MIHQDGQPTTNQHHHKKEIEEMAITHPDRKPVRACEVVGIYLGNRGNMRESRQSHFDPSRRHCRKDRDAYSYQDGRPNPNAESAIRRVVNGLVCWVKRDHGASS